jgi:hypothetical protein
MDGAEGTVCIRHGAFRRSRWNVPLPPAVVDNVVVVGNEVRIPDLVISLDALNCEC